MKAMEGHALEFHEGRAATRPGEHAVSHRTRPGVRALGTRRPCSPPAWAGRTTEAPPPPGVTAGGSAVCLAWLLRA